MATSRKCPKCNTWNEDKDYCTHCGELLNFEIQMQLNEEKREQILSEREKNAFERFLLKMKNSKYFPIVGLYYVIYSVYFVFFAFLSFLLGLITLGSG